MGVITGIRSWLSGQIETKSNMSLDQLVAAMGGVETAAGHDVGPESALTEPTTNACVNLIADTIAALPLIVYERVNDGKRRAIDHPCYRLLHDRPCAWLSSFEFRRQLQADILLHGRAAAHIGRADNQIAELIALPGSTVRKLIDDRTLEPSFEVTLADGSMRSFAFDELLYLEAPGGWGPAALAREAIGLSLALARHVIHLVGRGARPSGIFEADGRLSNEQVERISLALARSHAGSAAGRTLILDSGTKWKPVQFTSVDMQFTELRKQQVIEILKFFRVPPSMIGEMDRATWSNAEEMNRQFLTMTLTPWLTLWEQVINRTLFADDDQFFCEFLTDNLVRADTAARFEALHKAIGAPWLSVNEGRAIENREPVDGGDRVLTPLNMSGQADA